jgi:O-antigen/teichoic acid export membrane protein
MSMGKKVAGNVLGTSVSILSGLLRNKIFAAILSLNLFGIISIGQQSASLLFTLFAFGVPLGITTIASQLANRSPDEQRAGTGRIVVIVTGISVFVFAILIAVVAFDPEFFSRIITGGAAYKLPVNIIILSTPFMVVENSIYAILEGMGRLRQIMLFKIIPAFLILPVTYFLTTSYQIVGAALSILIGEVLLCAVVIVLLGRVTGIGWNPAGVGALLRNIFKVAVLSFIVGTTWLLSDFIVKRTVLTSLGEVSNAIVQSVAKVTDLYPMVALAWLAMHLFPVVASGEGDRNHTAKVIERTTLVAVAIVVPVILFLFAFRSPILAVIYGREFLLADLYFGAMLTTGVVKVVSWVLGVGLLAAGLRREWFISSILLNGVYLAGNWIGLSVLGNIYILPVSLGTGMLIQCFYCLMAYRRHGILFSQDFTVYLLLFGLLTCLLIGSVSLPLLLIAAAFVYFVLMRQSDLLKESTSKASALFRRFTRGDGKQ